MNRLDLNQTGGVPLSTQILDGMQQAYYTANKFGLLAGDLIIVTGCVDSGTAISDGYVIIAGELLFFKGTSKSANVVIQEIAESPRGFEDGSAKPVIYTRYATLGSGSVTYPWADFTRPLTIKQLTETILELSGRILPAKKNPQMYCGSIEDIPAGWQLCDGTNGTPDLRGRFIVGYDSLYSDISEIGNTGGSKMQTPAGSIANTSVSITVPRDGWGTSGSSPSPSISVVSGRLLVGSGNPELGEDLDSVRAAGSDKTVTASHTHDFIGTEFDNRPPYFTLAFIIYVGF